MSTIRRRGDPRTMSSPQMPETKRVEIDIEKFAAQKAAERIAQVWRNYDTSNSFVELAFVTHMLGAHGKEIWLANLKGVCINVPFGLNKIVQEIPNVTIISAYPSGSDSGSVQVAFILKNGTCCFGRIPIVWALIVLGVLAVMLAFVKFSYY